MIMPLNVGIDQVSMHMSFGEISDLALDLIDELAQRYKLTLYDPQGGQVTRPADIRKPVNPTWVLSR